VIFVSFNDIFCEKKHSMNSIFHFKRCLIVNTQAKMLITQASNIFFIVYSLHWARGLEIDKFWKFLCTLCVFLRVTFCKIHLSRGWKFFDLLLFSAISIEFSLLITVAIIILNKNKFSLCYSNPKYEIFEKTVQKYVVNIYDIFCN